MIQDLRYDMRCYFNVCSKANTSELNPWASEHRGKWGQLTPLENNDNDRLTAFDPGQPG